MSKRSIIPSRDWNLLSAPDQLPMLALAASNMTQAFQISGLALRGLGLFESEVSDIKAALSDAAVVAYCRPFTQSNHSNGSGEFKSRIPDDVLLADYTNAEKDLHEEFRGLRHAYAAHSDARFNWIKFFRSRAPDPVWSALIEHQFADDENLKLLQVMTVKVRRSVQPLMAALAETVFLPITPLEVLESVGVYLGKGCPPANTGSRSS